MNNKTIILATILSSSLFFACGKKEELEEVKIPETTIVTEEEGVSSPKDVVANEGAFKMMGLNFAYADLEPYMDSKTVETHYSKHHLGYTNKLNEAVKGTDLETKSIEEILTTLDPKNTNLKNNAGGYYNHNLFWDILAKNKGGNPTGKIGEYIKRDFGSFEAFKALYKKAGTDLFGSGWVWLISTDTGALKIVTTINQNNPLMPYEEFRGYPLMNLDVWEHAYYLKFRNNKSDYIDNYFKLIDWEKINYRIDLQNK